MSKIWISSNLLSLAAYWDRAIRYRAGVVTPSNLDRKRDKEAFLHMDAPLVSLLLFRLAKRKPKTMGKIPDIENEDIPNTKGVVYREAESIFNGRLHYKKLNLLAGAGGTGKSTLALGWCARLSNGEPFEEPGVSGEAPTEGECLYLSFEDTLETRIAPMYEAFGGKVGSLRFSNGRYKSDPHASITELSIKAIVEKWHEDEVNKGNLPLFLVIDPWANINCSNGFDSTASQGINHLISVFRAMTEDLGLYTVILAHTNKYNGQSLIDSITGSKTLVDGMRSNMVYTYIQDDNGDCSKTERGLRHVKVNDSAEAPDLIYKSSTKPIQVYRKDGSPFQKDFHVYEFDRREVFSESAPGQTAESMSRHDKKNQEKRSVREKKVSELRKKIYSFGSDGVSRKELMQEHGYKSNTLSQYVKSLKDIGCVKVEEGRYFFVDDLKATEEG